jgi:hypothetical protein
MSEKEKRIKSITKLYYSNPKVQQAIFNFSKDREVIPRYFQGFGKRPDSLQYISEVMNLANKGTTSFHCSEELWEDTFQINLDMSREEQDELRKAWDLLIDIDSPFLDYSKIAAKLIIEVLEDYGIKNYGIKFSGSKGFHIIVPSLAFPEKFNEIETKKMFPEWPRAISEFLMYKIRQKYNKIVSESDINYEALKERTNLSKEDITKIVYSDGTEAKKGTMFTLKCEECGNIIKKPNHKITKRKIKCIEPTCLGFYNVEKSEEYFSNKDLTASSLSKLHDSENKVVYSREAKLSKAKESDFKEEVFAEKIASLDLVLVASRHLFRMPYSLHEKTALSSMVLLKEELENFSPKDANPLGIKVREFYLTPEKDEAKKLLSEAIEWKNSQEKKEERNLERKYSNYQPVDISGVTEGDFPNSIKKLLKGLKDGRKRGLFVLLTFLKSLNFKPDFINNKIRDWNKKNSPPLKEGYLKSQIDWHFKQKRKILPPNYSNDSFYKDLKLLDKQPNVKNPLVEVIRKIKKKNN